MKAITVHVSEPVYEAFKNMAKCQERSAAALIREAMERYKDEASRDVSSGLLEIEPVAAGGMKLPLEAGEDLLEDMLDGGRT